MAAGLYNVTVEQGATWSEVWTWKDASGNPVNLTGYTAKMEIRSASGGTLLLHLDSTNGGLTLGGAAGTITPLIAAAQTALLATTLSQSYLYDLFLTSAGGTVTRLLAGTVTVVPSITA